MPFAQKLLTLMRRVGLTQQALAEKLSLTHPAVGKWLKGAKPRPRALARLAALFGVPAEILDNDNLDLPPDHARAMSEHTTWLAQITNDPAAREALADGFAYMTNALSDLDKEIKAQQLSAVRIQRIRDGLSSFQSDLAKARDLATKHALRELPPPTEVDDPVMARVRKMAVNYPGRPEEGSALQAAERKKKLA